MSSVPVPAESLHQIPCGICRRQFSKYVCPRCNVTYCSIICFRSESHSQCSESFYRKEIEAGIGSAPSKTAEERSKMMELLKRFEEDSLNDEASILDELNEDDNDGDGQDLASRLSHIDLDSVSPDALWSLLTPEERDKFLKTLNDPSSDLAQQLLSSEELENQRTEPWWEDHDASVETDLPKPSVNHPPRKYHGKKPEIHIRVPSSIVKAPASGSSLLYNTCAICIAYAYTTRSLSISPLSSAQDISDIAEAQRSISSLVPFLADRKSRLLYTNLSSVVTDIWSRFDQGQMTSTLFSLLLRDIAVFLRPSKVVEISSSITRTDEKSSAGADQDIVDLEAHPSATVFRVLSDLSHLFDQATASPPSGQSRVSKEPKSATPGTSRPSHISHKLTFYAAHVLSTPSFVLDALSNEIIMRSQSFQNETDVGLANRQGSRKKREIESIADGRDTVTEIRMQNQSASRVDGEAKPREAYIEELS